jgi:gamma-D-glutamyl-L-lysine dipeptidyl-peptidase
MNVFYFGICRLSVVSVRRDPSDRSEMVTQLLFGDHYEVLESDGDQKWLRIRIQADRYEGWIDRKQHHEISPEYFEYLGRAEFKITTDLTSTILFNKIPLVILIGSIIPISSSELFKMEEQYAFNGESKNLGQKREFDYMKTVATKFLGAPYLWGGKTPFGIDCSGLTQMVFRICGYNLQRDAWQQALQGKPLKDDGQPSPGDLAFFCNRENKIVHVGIVFPESRIIHASGRVRIDKLTPDGIINSDTGEKTHELAHFRHILSDG